MNSKLARLIFGIALFGLILQPSTSAATRSSATPAAGPDDPCAGVLGEAEIEGEASVAPAGEEISRVDAVIGAVSIHQRNVVTTLRVVVAYSDDPSFVSFAEAALPDAQRLADELETLSDASVTAHPAAMMGVLDALRQEHGRAGDAGSIDPYLDGYQLRLLCRPEIDLEGAARQSVELNDREIVRLAEISDLVVKDVKVVAVMDRARKASTDRLAAVGQFPEASTPTS